MRNFAELVCGEEVVKTNELTVVDKRKSKATEYRKIGCGLS